MLTNSCLTKNYFSGRGNIICLFKAPRAPRAVLSTSRIITYSKNTIIVFHGDFVFIHGIHDILPNDKTVFMSLDPAMNDADTSFIGPLSQKTPTKNNGSKKIVLIC